MTVQPAASPVGVPEQKGRFGTFAGVFTPNVLTILGLILFLRTGWVVDQRPLPAVLAMILAGAVGVALAGMKYILH